MPILRLDHLVLTVRDIEATCAFYCTVLAMQRVTFGDGRTALRCGEQKINLHQAGREFEPKATYPTPGSADLCFVVDRSPQETIAQVQSHGVRIVEGPVPRAGALGPVISIYLRDPDANLIELAYYPDSEGAHAAG